MQHIAIRPTVETRQVTSVIRLDDQFIDRARLGERYLAEHYFDSYRNTWNWTTGLNYTVDSSSHTLFEFSDGTYGVCPDEHVGSALAELNLEVAP